MSFGFEMDTRGQRETLGYLQQNVATPSEAEDEASPGFFAGTGGLFMSELASAGRSVAIAGGAIPAAIDWVVGDDNKGEPLADRYFRAVDEPTRNAVEFWKPAPAATGVGGRVLGTVAGGLAELAAVGGNPALMIARQQIGTAGELVDQGVDATTAQLVGGAQGLATAAGFRLGTVGNTLGKQVASGAAGNLATNIPAAAGSQAILEQSGFTEQAKQFNPWDLEARAIDVLMGAAFGAVAHYGPKPADTANTPRTDLPPSQQAEILAAAAARNWAVDTAPGRPATDADLAMHHNAMSTALVQMMRGEPVDVSAHIEGATFSPRESSGFDLDAAMREEFGAAYDAQKTDLTRPDEAPAPISRADVKTSRAEADTTTAAQAVGKMVEPEEPEIIAARAAIERQPAGEMIDLGDADNPMLVDAREAMKQVDEEMRHAKNDAAGFMAAVTCYLGG